MSIFVSCLEEVNNLMKQPQSAMISQSNYIPWKGYFDAIQICETFVVYDDMQYTRRDWRNRNLIKTSKGLKWMTIPVVVSGRYLQKIKDTRIADKNWTLSHWSMLRQHYKSAACFDEMAEWIEPLYKECAYEFLTDVNMHFISGISNFLGIKTTTRYSSEFDLHEDRNQRLVDICLDLDVKEYYTGPAARSYMETDRFTSNDIRVHFLDYSGYPEYPQLFPPFEHGVSILDLILNAGNESKKYMKYIL